MVGMGKEEAQLFLLALWSLLYPLIVYPLYFMQSQLELPIRVGVEFPRHVYT